MLFYVTRNIFEYFLISIRKMFTCIPNIPQHIFEILQKYFKHSIRDFEIQFHWDIIHIGIIDHSVIDLKDENLEHVFFNFKKIQYNKRETCFMHQNWG